MQIPVMKIWVNADYEIFFLFDLRIQTKSAVVKWWSPVSDVNENRLNVNENDLKWDRVVVVFVFLSWGTWPPFRWGQWQNRSKPMGQLLHPNVYKVRSFNFFTYLFIYLFIWLMFLIKINTTSTKLFEFFFFFGLPFFPLLKEVWNLLGSKSSQEQAKWRLIFYKFLKIPSPPQCI